VPVPLTSLASTTHVISPRTTLSPAMVRSNPPLLTQPYTSKASDSGETASTSVGSAIFSVRQLPLELERRLASLEEEMIAVNRRLNYGDGQLTGEAGASQDDGESMQVHPLAARDSASEERARQLEVRLAGLEAALEKDRQERVAQFASLTGEVANTMRALMKRIDEGLAAGAFAPVPPAASVIDAATEERLRSLITRVDLGLATGAAALRETLKGAGIGEDALPSQRLRPSGMARSTAHSPSQSRSPSKGAVRPASTTAASTGVLRPAIVRSPSSGQGPLPLATDSVRTLSPRPAGTSILVNSPGKTVGTGLLSPRTASPAFPLFSVSQGSASLLSSIRGRTSPPVAGGGVVRSTSEVSRSSVSMLRGLS